jgi:gliding motility-associated-like protein
MISFSDISFLILIISKLLMGKPLRIVFACLVTTIVLKAQINCPSPYVFMDGSQFIRFYDPGQPLSASNPSNTNIPTFGSGLTLMPNINGGTLCPTFYSTSGGTYWYWSGASWVNTGHSTGNNAAVNLGGCGSKIYNIVGATGQIYVYDGTGNGSLLTTINGFSAGGPFDLVTDCDCNFYALKTTTTGSGQSLTKYSPSGSPLATWTLVNMPNATAGGGFAIIGNMLYLKNNMTNGFFMASIGTTAVTFTQVTGFTASPGDFASCPNNCTMSPTPFSAGITGALLTCSNPTANLVVTTTASPVTYTWTGPGIIGPANGSVIAVNSQGPYTCVVISSSCPNSTLTLFTSVYTNTSVVTAVVSPSGNICTAGNLPTMLTVTHSSPSEVVSWAGPGINNSPNADSLLVPGAGSFTVTVTDPSNGCSARDVVNIVQSPSVSLSLTSNTLCALPFNGSPASITITPAGASTYTLFTSGHYATGSPNGPVMPVSVVNAANGMATGTLIGNNAFCSDTAYTTFQIIPNPAVNVAPAAICPGQTHVFYASGATSYTWTDQSQNTFYGNNLVSSPSVTSTYTIIGSDAGCNSLTQTTTLTVKPVPTVSVTPATSTICLGSVVTLNTFGTANSFTWTPATGLSNANAATVTASPPSTQGYVVTGALNGCTNTASALVNIVPPPQVNVVLSSNSMCFKNYNGSPNSLSLTPAGAISYTLLPGSSYNVQNPNGPVMKVTPAGPPFNGTQLVTSTLIAESGVCSLTLHPNFFIISNPVVSILPPSASICPGQSQQFSAAGADTYYWLPAMHMHTVSPAAIVASPPNTSFYSVYGASQGCFSDTKNAVLVVLPVPIVTVSPVMSTVCAGNPIQLAAGGTGSAYTWTPSTALSAQSGKTVTAAPFTTQSYTVISTLNTCTSQAVATVSAIPIPVITAFATQSVICSGASTGLNAVGAQAYSWTPASSLNHASGNAVIASPLETTTYTVWGFNGICRGSTTTQVQTVKRPDLMLGAINGQNEICLGSSMTLTVSGAQAYGWNPPQWVQPQGTYTIVKVNPPVTTNFTVTGTTSQGSVTCFQQMSYSVMVVPKLQAKLSGNVSICEGQKTTLSASGGNTFRWTPATGLNATEGSRVVAGPGETTIYTVEVSNSGYCATTGTLLVEVFPSPYVSAGRDTSYHVNDAIILNAAGTGSISWVSGEGIRCPGCPVTQVYPSKSGCYIAESINEFGCYSQDEVCLDIRADYSIYIPNSFSPNGDGLNDVFRVYGENFSQLKVDVYNRWGQLLFRSSDVNGGWDGTFNGAACEQGTYTYRISYTGLDSKVNQVTGHVNLLR